MAQLGTYISNKDLNRILSPGIRKNTFKLSYFSTNELAQVARVHKIIDEFSGYLFQNTSFPYPTIIKTQDHMKEYIPRLQKMYTYVSKLRTCLHYLARLDNLLGIGLTVKEFNLIKKGIGFGNSKEFTFMSMRYKQRQQQRGLIGPRVKEVSS